MDEPQNMSSTKSHEAIRTLKPLFSLRYSATHRETPNLVYRLTPVEAFRRSLVKRIQVVGVEQRELGGKIPLSLNRSSLLRCALNSSSNSFLMIPSFSSSPR